MIGYGAVAKCTLPILLKHVQVSHQNITIIDFIDKRRELKPWIKKGIRFVQDRVTAENLNQLLSTYVSPGGLIIDLSWNIETLDMLKWCHEHKVLYVNTSVEEWDPYTHIDKKTPLEKSLYFKQMTLRKATTRWNANSTTAVVDHGANPGMISHFTKKGIRDIAEKMLRDKSVSKDVKKLIKELLSEGKFPELAMNLDIKTIHISERDTQISNQPKRVNEFVGTWSIEGLREEGTAPSEIGWGTHEKALPHLATVPSYGPKNQIFLSQMGMNTWVRSWVPYQEIIGMAIRHGEAFSISDYLTVRKKGKVSYRPTVHYAYMPCDETISSLHELRARNYHLQPEQRIMNNEIIDGSDVLGALLMGHPYKSWWTGSILSIQEARKIVPYQNATTIQVGIGVVSSIIWMIENPNKGVCLPDDLPYDYILNIARPYLGKLVSEASDWTPLKNYQIFFRENPGAYLDEKNLWCFQNFLFRD